MLPRYIYWLVIPSYRRYSDVTKKCVSYFAYLNRLIGDFVRLPARKYPIVDAFFPNRTI